MFEQDKIRITGKPVTETKAMRDVYADTLMELAAQDGRIVILDADLMNSIGTVPFARAYPERSFNCGIQEANMIGTAAGMSAVGLIPFTHTFGCFASRRVADQVFMSCAYAELNVKMIGSDPGISGLQWRHPYGAGRLRHHAQHSRHHHCGAGRQCHAG